MKSNLVRKPIDDYAGAYLFRHSKTANLLINKNGSKNPGADKTSRKLSVQHENGNDRAKIDCSCAMVVLFVCEYFDLTEKQLLSPTRASADTAQVRQIAIYLAHTMFSISYTDVARYFKRDRTTISHACHLVEDLRDNEQFDGKLERLENLIAIAIKYAKIQNINVVVFENSKQASQKEQVS